MTWSVKKRVVCSCIVGWGLAIIGAVMIPVLEYVIKLEVQDNVVIKEGGELYPIWRDLPIPIYMQFYMFNLTNPSEFLKGARPAVQQLGPYTYSEKRVKFNITFNSNGTVTYRQKRIFNFIRDMSVGSEDDMLITPNPLFWTVYFSFLREDGELRKVMEKVTDFFDERPIMKRSVKEVLWGYKDDLLAVLKDIDDEWFYTYIAGYFVNKNNTDDGVYTIFTGEKDINKVGVIDKYNGSGLLNFWTTEWANMINGTDGTLGPPYLDKSMVVSTFASDVCRSVSGVYNSDVHTPQGIKLWRYTAPESYAANASVNPDNLGFCTPQSKCLGAGLLNVSNCQLLDFFHIPVVLSLPHFYMGDPKYIDAVVGMHPNAEEHQVAIDVEPYTGLVLQVAKRLQVNLYMSPIANMSETLGITPVFMPIFWLNESAVVDDANANKLKRMLFTPMKAIHVVEGVVIGLGIAVIIASAVYAMCKRNRPKQERRAGLTIPSESSSTSYGSTARSGALNEAKSERKPLLSSGNIS